MLTMEVEIERKCLDQMSSLVHAYEAGKISGDALHIGVETMWACLSGVIKSDGFNELIHDANVYLQDVPRSPQAYDEVIHI